MISESEKLSPEDFQAVRAKSDIFKPLSREEVLNYELRASRYREKIKDNNLEKIVGFFFKWYVEKKYRRYRDSVLNS